MRVSHPSGLRAEAKLATNRREAKATVTTPSTHIWIQRWRPIGSTHDERTKLWAGTKPPSGIVSPRPVEREFFDDS